MRAYELFEAIDTAKITNDAYSALTRVFSQVAKRLSEQVAHDFGGDLTDSESLMRVLDRRDFYDTALDPYLDQFLQEASKALTTYIRTYVQEFPDGRSITANEADRYHVRIEARETTKDSYAKHSGGYFDNWGKVGFDGETDEMGKGIKVFTDRAEWRRPFRNTIVREWFGESEEDGIQQMVAEILPTFVHEMSHLDVFSRRPKAVRDFTYIRKPAYSTRPVDNPNPNPKPGEWATKWVGHGGKGKRGGDARSAQKGGVHRMRYLGSTHELDAFASGAATAIIQDIKRREEGWRGRDAAEFNMDIDAAIEDLSTSYEGFKRVQQADYYWNNLVHTLRAQDAWYPDKDHPEGGTWGIKPAGTQRWWDAEKEEYREETYNQKDLQKIWNRFRKLLVQKLYQFKKDNTTAGKWATRPQGDEYAYERPRQHGLDPEMAAIMRQHTTSREQFEAMAEHAARNLYQEYANSYYYSPEDTVNRLEAGDNVGLWKYTDFLATWFFGTSYSDRAQRLEPAFCRLVGKRLRRLLAQNPTPMAAD